MAARAQAEQDRTAPDPNGNRTVHASPTALQSDPALADMIDYG